MDEDDSIEIIKRFDDVVNEAIHSYVINMRKRLEAVSFLSHDELEKQNQEILETVFQYIQNLKTSEDEDTEENMVNIKKRLKREYDQLKQENDNRNVNAANNAVDKSLTEYKNEMERNLRVNFVSEDKLLEMSKREAEKVIKIIEDLFVDDKEELMNPYLNLLKEKIKEEENNFKAINDKNLSDAKQQNSGMVSLALHEYTHNMRVSLKDNPFLADDLFGEHHNFLKKSSIIKFEESYKLGDDAFINGFLLELETKIQEAYKKYSEQNQFKLQKTHFEAQNTLKEASDFYINSMYSLIDDNKVFSISMLEEKHQEMKQRATDKFIEKCKCKDDNFIAPYREQLNANNEENMIKIKAHLERKLEAIENDTNELVDDLMKQYQDEMKKMLNTAESQIQLEAKHNELKESSINKLKDKCPFGDPQISQFLEQIESNMNETLEDFSSWLNDRLEKQESILKVVIIEATTFYKHEMAKFRQKSNFYLAPKLLEFHEKLISLTISKHESKRGKMSLEKFESAINEALGKIFVRIKEENDQNAPTIPAIGIDLGTTNSCVAYYQPDINGGKVVIIENQEGEKTTPSCVKFNDDGEVVGSEARERGYENPKNMIYSVKRLIGRNFNESVVQNDMCFWPFDVVDDGNNNPKIRIRRNDRSESFYPEQISAKVLKKMKAIAERHLNCRVDNAVITIPAYFNDAQREATYCAASMAGLKVLRIINEPTAAALAYRLNHHEGDTRKVLIFDLGGGTFDVAVLEIKEGNIKIIAVGGDNHLGGDDFDNNMINYCIQEFTKSNNLESVIKNNNVGQRAMCRLRLECERMKKRLSAGQRATVTQAAFYDGKDLSVTFTRDQFEALNIKLFTKCMDAVEQTLVDANTSHNEIDDIVLVGGSTRIPKIQEMLQSLFPDKQLNNDINPDEAVAYGAAIQAAILNGSEAINFTITEVIPFSLGIKVKETEDGNMNVIIPRNSRIPEETNVTKSYSTISNNQTEVEVKIYEGEEAMVENNRELGTFVVKDIPPAPAGEEQIDITFEINYDGILHAKAKIISNGVWKDTQIIEYKGRLPFSEVQALSEQKEYNS